MDYVLTENGNIKVTNGQPTVKDGDKEFGIDAIGAQAKITAITIESNDRRKKLGEATTALDAFKDIKDPVAALDALQKLSSLDSDQAAALDSLKDTINKAWEAKEGEWTAEKQGLTDKLFTANVGSQFATSEVIKKTVLTPDIAAKFFGPHFNPDGTANDAAGNLIYSKSKPGEAADFEEAIQHIINSYPGKEEILRASGADGGAGFDAGDGSDDPLSITRESFEALGPLQRTTFIKKGGTVN
jgi:hypothetical protein